MLLGSWAAFFRAGMFSGVPQILSALAALTRNDSCAAFHEDLFQCLGDRRVG